MPLNTRQVRVLRGLAHHLAPVLIVGSDRVTPAVAAELERQLQAHELVKVKLLDADNDDVVTARDQLVAATGAEHVQTIGHRLVFFRRNSDAPKIAALPGEKLRPAAARGRR